MAFQSIRVILQATGILACFFIFQTGIARVPLIELLGAQGMAGLLAEESQLVSPRSRSLQVLLGQFMGLVGHAKR